MGSVFSVLHDCHTHGSRGAICLRTQVTLPLRFLVMTAHFIAVITILFDLVRVRTAASHLQLAAVLRPRRAPFCDAHYA